ncbi:Vegetative incompatibility protein HET-E-1 [Cladobotryum mycophilum]|uniref:Vegetative incompatibility protein HET-E-1 n=1 Tax=Cladobotryum mycophilum TaxID=491253 RepID=A0ABR0SGE1_9HYPO
MRLLNTRTLHLEVFPSHEAVRYAVLSHTWGKEEVTFQDVSLGKELRDFKGWEKIRKSCQVAVSLRLDYIWIDTCCIDKASSAELSEAINSMFQWYEQAEVCIAFMDDVSSADDLFGSGSQFRRSRWFTRGWTLQELIAPSNLSFYSLGWEPLGTRSSLKGVIGDVTGIPGGVLESQAGGRRARLEGISVAEKMSWAAKRVTTRPEDVAYCLLGIFDINMPLIYGEGRVKAFKRLQEEIIRSTGDDSIYAWRYPEDLAKRQYYWGLLAESPDAFGKYKDFMPKTSRYLTKSSNQATGTSSRGLYVELAITPYPKDKSGSIFLAFLDCDMRREGSHAFLSPAILLQKTSGHNGTDFVRICSDMLVLLMMNRIVFPDELVDIKKRDIAIPEAILRQIYVPHHLPVPRSPQGVVFYPAIAPPDDASFKVNVVSRSPTWQYFVDQSDSYVLSFETTPVPGVEELKEAMMIGNIELEISDGWNSWNVCLVIGLEPLPPNTFDTPALYVAPWYAFETQSRVAAGDFEEVLHTDTRMKYHALQKQSLRARFDLQSRFSRQFYSVILEVDRSDDKGKMNLPWKSIR